MRNNLTLFDIRLSNKSTLKKIGIIGGACTGAAASLSAIVQDIALGSIPSLITGGMQISDDTSADWNVDGSGPPDLTFFGTTTSSAYSMRFSKRPFGGWNDAGAVDTSPDFVLNASSFANSQSLAAVWSSALQNNVKSNDFTGFTSDAGSPKTAQFQFNSGANVGWVYVTVNNPADPTAWPP